MSYSDSKYYSRPLVDVAIINGTATASGTNALTGNDLKTAAPLFQRPYVVNKVIVVNDLATPANWTALKLVVKNGTNTVATATGLATGTNGSTVAPAVTVANATFGSGSAPTFVLDGTSTASGQSVGTFSVYLEVQEQFSTTA